MRSTTALLSLLLTFAVASPVPDVPLPLPADVPPNYVSSDFYNGINPGLPGPVTGPFHRLNSTILDSNGTPFIISGATWPAHITTVPEGLQHASIRDTIHRLRSLGLNTIRLTFSTDMLIQNREADYGDRTMTKALQEALGDKRVGPLLDKVLQMNPELQDKKRLEVYDEIAFEAARQGMGIILDNVNTHPGMGYEGWPVDEVQNSTAEFNGRDWRWGLEQMARRAKDWPTFIGISLRAQLDTEVPEGNSWGVWSDWYFHMMTAAEYVHAANPSALIFMTGIDNGQDASRLVLHQALTEEGKKFDLEKRKFGDKVVLSMMKYPKDAKEGCWQMKQDLYNKGFRATGRGEFQVPVVMMGWGMDELTSVAMKGEYATCMREFLKTYKSGWIYDSIAGSYYMEDDLHLDVENTDSKSSFLA